MLGPEPAAFECGLSSIAREQILDPRGGDIFGDVAEHARLRECIAIARQLRRQRESVERGRGDDREHRNHQ